MQLQGAIDIVWTNGANLIPGFGNEVRELSQLSRTQIKRAFFAKKLSS
jgi:hypothetical protein